MEVITTYYAEEMTAYGEHTQLLFQRNLHFSLASTLPILRTRGGFKICLFFLDEYQVNVLYLPQLNLIYLIYERTRWGVKDVLENSSVLDPLLMLQSIIYRRNWYYEHRININQISACSFLVEWFTNEKRYALQRFVRELQQFIPYDKLIISNVEMPFYLRLILEELVFRDV